MTSALGSFLRGAPPRPNGRAPAPYLLEWCHRAEFGAGPTPWHPLLRKASRAWLRGHLSGSLARFADDVLVRIRPFASSAREGEEAWTVTAGQMQRVPAPDWPQSEASRAFVRHRAWPSAWDEAPRGTWLWQAAARVGVPRPRLEEVLRS